MYNIRFSASDSLLELWYIIYKKKDNLTEENCKFSIARAATPNNSDVFLSWMQDFVQVEPTSASSHSQGYNQ